MTEIARFKVYNIISFRIIQFGPFELEPKCYLAYRNLQLIGLLPIWFEMKLEI